VFVAMCRSDASISHVFLSSSGRVAIVQPYAFSRQP
jgi:hypothetical protein